MINSLLYSMIDVNVLTYFLRRFFICLIESSVLINDVVCSAVFLFKLTVIIVVIFVVLKLIVFICSFIMIHFDLLRVVRSVLFFVSLIVEWFSSILIRLTVQIWVFIFWCKLYWLIFVSTSLQWNHNSISRSLLISIEQRVLIHWMKRKRVLKKTLNWAVWQKKRELTIRKLILRLI